MSWILGLNADHADSSAALLREGEVVAAVEEERLRRVKHWAGFPAQAIRACLEQGGVRLGQIEHLALNVDPRANWAARLAFLLRVWEGFDVAATAGVMGCSEGSVKTHLFRAMDALKKRLEDHR